MPSNPGRLETISVLIVSMPSKLNINARGVFRTWHFTSVLTPTHQIRADIDTIITNTPNVSHPYILLVKAYIREKVINQARPECVTFISWRFSRSDAALWVSNARVKIPLSDLHFEGYVQSTDPIDLPRLHRWMQDATWENVSGKLYLSTAYQQFSVANDAFEFCNDGSPALSQGGRPKKATAVSTGHTISMFYPPFYHLTVPTMIIS